MEDVTKKSIAVFAVFGAVLMLSAAFVQPVSAKASGQADVLQKYDSYLSKIQKLGRELSSDKTLMSLSDKLTKNSALNKIIEQAKSAKNEIEIKALAEKFGKILTKQKEYKEIENIINTKYREDVKSLEDFAAKLRNKPNDASALLQSLADEDNENSEGDVYVVQAIPFTAQSGSSHLGGKSATVSKSVKYNAKGSPLQSSTSTKAGGNHGGTSVGCMSSHAVLKQDLNGNIYVYVPGQGWVNPTWFPGFWLLVFLFLLWDAIVFVVSWIIGVLIPGVIATIATIFWIIVIIIWWILDHITGGSP